MRVAGNGGLRYFQGAWVRPALTVSLLYAPYSARLGVEHKLSAHRPGKSPSDGKITL